MFCNVVHAGTYLKNFVLGFLLSNFDLFTLKIYFFLFLRKIMNFFIRMLQNIFRNFSSILQRICPVKFWWISFALLLYNTDELFINDLQSPALIDDQCRLKWFAQQSTDSNCCGFLLEITWAWLQVANWERSRNWA